MISWTRIKCRQFVGNERGTTSIEYALIAVIIAVGIITSVGNVGTAVTELYTAVINAFPA